VHFGVLLVHCAVDFDMSFFYVKLLAFVLIGIISSYKTEEKLEGKKILQRTSAFLIILFFIANSYGNITLKIAENLVDDKKKIYNFDGPGLRKEIIKSHKYKRIKDRLNYIVPNHSIVGLILRHDDNIKVVKSVKKDLSAHSIFNWEVLDYAFKDAVLSRLSKNLDSSIVMWLDSHEDCEREKIGKAIFEFLRKNGLNDVSNLIKIRTLFMLLKNSKELDNETKKVLGNFIKFNVDYMKQNKKEKSSLS